MLKLTQGELVDVNAKVASVEKLKYGKSQDGDAMMKTVTGDRSRQTQ